MGRFEYWDALFDLSGLSELADSTSRRLLRSDLFLVVIMQKRKPREGREETYDLDDSRLRFVWMATLPSRPSLC